MDTLVGIGTLVAFTYSSILLLFPEINSVIKAPEGLYFDVTIVVIAFITFGKYLEARSKLKTGEAIEKLLGLQAKTALVLRGGKEVEIPISEVILGDIVIVSRGQDPGGRRDSQRRQQCGRVYVDR
jgi:Cu2+-exporting ATPase/Cu+-exporting ATPase